LSNLISKHLLIAIIFSSIFFIPSCVSDTPVKKPRPRPQKVDDRSIKIDAFSEAIAGFESKSMVTEKDIEEAFVYKSGTVQIKIPLGDAVLSADITPQEILVVVRKHLTAMRLCYEQELKKDPIKSCRIEPKFLIGLDGIPGKIEIPDRQDCSQEFVACFKEVVNSMRFPKPRGGEPIEVFYPFVFSPI
jgi:hypothetical protein